MMRLLLVSLAGCLLVPLPSLAQPQPEPLPKYAVNRFGSGKLRHGSPIRCLAFSADDKVLAAGGSDDPLRLWNVDTGMLQRSLPQTWVTAVAFSPRDGMLAAAGAFKTIHVWDPANGNELAVLRGHTSSVKALVYSPDGSLLASGGRDGTVMLWKPNFTNPLDTFAGHVDEVTALAFSPSGSLLASAGTDRTIRLWSLHDKDKKASVIDAGCAVTGLVFSGDGKILISAGDDNLIHLWDPATGKPLDTFKGHEDCVASLLLSRDGKTLVSGGRDRSVRLWDLPGRKPGRVHVRDSQDGEALAMSGDGKLLAYAGYHNTIHFVDTDSGKELLAGLGATAPITGLALSRNDKMVIAVSADRMIRQWQVPNSRILATYRAGPVGDLTVPLALTGLLDGGMIKRGDTIASDDAIVAVTASRDGATFAVGHRSGKVDLLRPKEKAVLQYPGVPRVLAFSANGKSLAVSGEGTVVLFDTVAARKTRQFTTNDAPAPKRPRVACLAFSPTGKHLAVGCYDGVVRMFDSASGKQTSLFAGHASAVLSLAFSPDGRLLATGSFDKGARMWEAFNGPEHRSQYESDVGMVAQYVGHVGPVQAVCFAHDGRSFFSGSSDTTVLQWDATRRFTDGVLPVVALNADDLDDAWTKLATQDAGRGQEMTWKLTAGAADSVKYLGGKLTYVDSKQIDKLFADLNDDAFSVRFKATEALHDLCKKHGMWMRSRLEEAMRRPPSEEVRQRAEQILDKLLHMPSALALGQERVRLYRCLQILEQAASPAAVEILEKLAGAAPEPTLQAEAQFALDRLRKKAP